MQSENFKYQRNPKPKIQNLKYLFYFLLLYSTSVPAQLKWQNVDSLFGPLPASVHVYHSTDPIEGKPNNAYYLVADLRDKVLEFTTDTTFKRRLTPDQFYQKNSKPLLVVNTTFFSFATNQNLNLVIRDKKLVSYNVHTINGRGKDTFTYRHPFGSAIGIRKNRTADIAWSYTDSTAPYAFAIQDPVAILRDSSTAFSRETAFAHLKKERGTGNRDRSKPVKWKMQTAVGGGPVLLQKGMIQVTNNEEWKFAGKAIEDRHPRTAMGYTADGKLIVLVIEGRFPGKAEGATLVHEAQILKDLGCVEAMNLDGGGSSCMLVNGRPTIKVSDAEGQRPVPAVFLIKDRKELK